MKSPAQSLSPSPTVVVTAAQMQASEAAIFAAGMPVAALMEKVALRIAAWVMAHFPASGYPQVGVLVGPGHNGGDALVVAHELSMAGYGVQICCPVERHKSLTADHLRFAQYLGISVSPTLPAQAVDLWVDGLFGFGLERDITGEMASLVDTLNHQPVPIISIDLPSGLQTDTGAVLGTAIRATHTLCLGLWKRAFCQDAALDYLGQSHLITFDIPPAAIQAGLGDAPRVHTLTGQEALGRLPLPRPLATHKYQVGSLLVIAGSRQYAGAVLLAGLGARASGVGMLTLAVPESLRWLVVGQLPEALVIGCAETDTGAIAALPPDLDLSRYDAIACGPGLSRSAGAVVETVLASPTPLLLDADGLNRLAELDPIQTLVQRTAPTILTPHPGEFKRLFPDLGTVADAGESAQLTAAQSQSIVVLKGACTAIAHPDGRLWFNTQSTPALARGGSGDVLTGLVGGLLAQGMAQSQTGYPTKNSDQPPERSPEKTLETALDAALAGVWWHAQAAQQAAADHTELGVDGSRLASCLTATLTRMIRH